MARAGVGGLCKRIESLDLDREIISGLVSYCELAQPLEAKQYLDVMLNEDEVSELETENGILLWLSDEREVNRIEPNKKSTEERLTNSCLPSGLCL